MPPIEGQELEQEDVLDPTEDFSDLLDLGDDVSDAVEEDPTEGPEVLETEESGEELPAGEEGEAPVVEEVPGDQPEEKQPEETPPQEEQPQEEAVEQPNIEAVKAKWMEELQESYKLSEEEADQFITEPDKVVPKLAAMMHQRITEDLLRSVYEMMPQYLQQMLSAQPQIIENTMSQAQAAKDAEAQFFTAFPDLKDHGNKVMEVAKFIRSAPENKGISREELMLKIGNASRAMLGLPIPAPTPEPAPQQQRPFSPARPGGSSGGDISSEQKTEWDEMIEIELP